MGWHNLPSSVCNDSKILSRLAAANGQANGDLQRAVNAILRDKKHVHIPDYDFFAEQGWGDLFGKSDPSHIMEKEGNASTPEEKQKQKSLQIELKGRLAPPAAFFQGHLAKELPSIVEAIGCTPLVQLSRVAAVAGCACQLLGKCEFLSPGGSIKDRIARAMVRAAQDAGRLTKGAALIEPTSGNTGIGLALVSAVEQYKSVAVMPVKMSAEKHAIMKALGARILRTPTKAPWNDQASHIAVALRLEEELLQQEKEKQQQPPSELSPQHGNGQKEQVACILDQYRNPANPLAHFFGTGEELLHQSGGKMDMVVISAGTGGTLTGVGKRVKEALPECVVVAVDPVGSVLADPREPPGAPYLVEGIGYDFVPTVLDRDVADFWVKVTDAESLACSRLLLQHEGMLVGGSSGSALAGTFKAIERMGWTEDKSKRIALLLPDGSRNYTSKFVSDEWMADKGVLGGFVSFTGFLEASVLDRQYPDYKELRVDSLELPRLRFVSAAAPLKDAALLITAAPSQPVLCVVQEPSEASKADALGSCPRDAVCGILFQEALLKALGGELPPSTPVEEVAELGTPIFNIKESLARLAQSLELRPFVLVEADGLVKAAVGHTLLLQALASKQQQEVATNGRTKERDSCENSLNQCQCRHVIEVRE